MSKRIIRGATVLALDGRRELRQTDVLIDGGMIAAIGGVDAPGALVTEVRGVLLPALVQAHVHTDFALTDQHFVPDVNPWLHTHHQLAAWRDALDPEARRVQAQGAFSRGVHAGAGCFGDVTQGAHESNVEAAIELGVRMVACVDGAREDPAPTIDRLGEFVERRCAEGLVSFGVFASNAEKISLPMLRRCARVAEANRLPLVVHAGELPGDRGALRRLDRAGALGPRLVLCHARADTLRSERVQKWVADAGASVVMTPTSDVLQHAITPPIASLLAAGINLAIGSDSGATRTGFDPFKELRLVQRHLAGHSENPASRALEIGALGGARALQVDTGSIQVGRRADLMLIDIEIIPGEEHERLAARLLDAAVPDAVRTVWINGEVAILDGRFAKGDPPAESAEEMVRGRLCHAVETRMRRISPLRRAWLDLLLRRHVP